MQQQKLSDEALAQIQKKVDEGYKRGVIADHCRQMWDAIDDVQLLLDHIKAESAAYKAWMQRAAGDAYENGLAVGDFIQKQAAEIEELKARIEAQEAGMELISGYSAFLEVCARSGEQPSTFEEYLKDASRR